MNNIKEVFTYENTELSIIKKDNDIWFKAKTIADILEYKNSREAIIYHVDNEDKIMLKDLNSGGNETLPLGVEKLYPYLKNTIYINESGLYSLILRSKMEKAKNSNDGSQKRYYHQLEKPEIMN